MPKVLNVSRLAADPNLRSISDAAQGILFFGTPHQSDRDLTIGTITARAILSTLPNTKHNVINAIKEDSAFEQISRTFLDHLSAKDAIRIVSFYSRRNSQSNPVCR
jgi:2-polyprenyl-3-methyl-5-hydroxy-6-metoxy-1,4-benzoquinol methylase